MTIRRFLIIAPAIVTLVLLASYFWVPTYEEQTKGNPDRLVQYINASTGDAAYLNPTISSDSASSEIENKVFEGLIDRDENLQYRGRVARSWKVYEHAYFYINEDATTAQWGRVDAETLVSNLTAALDPQAPQWEHVQAVELLPAQSFTQNFTLKQGKETSAYAVQARPPRRVRITLNKVDQKLFESLSALLGTDYFESFDPQAYITVTPSMPQTELVRKASEIMPVTEHNPIIEFYLRPGIKFHDGHELTAEDVKFTYDAIVNPKNLSPRVPDYEPVKKVDVIDPLTLRITYKRLYSPAFGTWGMGILPAHLLNDAALKKEAAQRGMNPAELTIRNSRFNRSPIGSGPFKFKEWKSDRWIRLLRYDDYWEGPPNYGQYVMRIIPDILTQEMEFYAGTVDSYGVQPHQVERLRQDKRFQSFSGSLRGYHYIGYNMRREPFKDVRVRRALGMAIDTNKIIKYLVYNQGEPISGPFVKETDFYNHKVPPLPYDPAGAVLLLREAGWTLGKDGYLQKNGKRLSFTLITNNGNPTRKAIIAIAQDAWKKIGIQVETDLLEWSVFIEKRVNQFDFDAVVLGWSMGLDPDLYQIWHSSQSGRYQLNFVAFSNPEADDLIIKIRQEYDHDQQVAYCHRLHEIIAEEQPYTFLYVSHWTALLDKRIVREFAGPDGRRIQKPIVPTKTGSYSFHFNQWIKLNQPLVFTAE